VREERKPARDRCQRRRRLLWLQTFRRLAVDQQAIIVDDGELVVLSSQGVEIKKIADGKLVAREPKLFLGRLRWRQAGVPAFMIKEIHEQAECLRNTLRVQEHYADLMATFLDRAREVYLVACGTSYHACLAASYMFSKLAFLPLILSSLQNSSNSMENPLTSKAQY